MLYRVREIAHARKQSAVLSAFLSKGLDMEKEIFDAIWYGKNALDTKAIKAEISLIEMGGILMVKPE